MLNGGHALWNLRAILTARVRCFYRQVRRFRTGCKRGCIAACLPHASALPRRPAARRSMPTPVSRGPQCSGYICARLKRTRAQSGTHELFSKQARGSGLLPAVSAGAGLSGRQAGAWGDAVACSMWAGVRCAGVRCAGVRCADARRP